LWIDLFYSLYYNKKYVNYLPSQKEKEEEKAWFFKKKKEERRKKGF